jgi:2',3'-cyclic-nucleotide 2'-phosphodiesterase (5'-nucleotidase family)
MKQFIPADSMNAVPTDRPRPITLRIVSFNDVYSLENLPRLKNLVKHHAAVNPADAFAVVLAGDFLAPSLLSSLDNGQGMADCLNAVGVTHVILGNHEDDIPTPELAKRIGELRATWIGTNVHGFGSGLVQHAILAVDDGHGRIARVGLVGVVMDDAAVYRDRPFGGTPVEAPNEAARREAARLEADLGCDFVVAITHQPMSFDRELASATRSPSFPVILGGHEHVVLVEKVGETWIAKAGHDASHAAIVDIAWTASGSGREVTVRVEAVAEYPEDADLRARVEGHLAKVHALEGVTILPLRAGEALSSVGTRWQETSMGSILCSRLRDALGADACVYNGGGIRASREYKERFTYGDLKAEMPFENEVVVVRLPGRVLADAVAFSRAKSPVESGGFLQVDDALLVTGGDHRVTHVGGAPLDPDRDYRVAMVRELLLGMDHIEPLVRFAASHPERIPPATSGREAKLVLVSAFSVALWRGLGGFDAIDANGDGVVTLEELTAALSRGASQPASPIAATIVLRALEEGPIHPLTRAEAETAEATGAATTPASKGAAGSS